ncbi:RNA-guided endonuclease TnpB family protein [Moorena producens JHB]|uniref:RNA-guided endonuclease TnpB family protein n=1 Tax=Moorena producens (strain JHB) TaxID=1454205 RepID=A0A1D9FYK1_MOOP1|nr:MULTISPECIES: RNA-guided endonuclease TnpB family protein [Moorena]AOY80456.1 RNA-guided endonuclease TnpB family protein [Moorena producens JHB]NEQ11350.1 IS200/IS605 family element transposase accessory protein TnpB [Moorena sp. SIO4E2]
MTEKAYRYRFYPTPEQETLLRRTLGCVRLVYNKTLDARTKGWYEHQKRVSYKETSSMLTEWKKKDELFFLNEVSSVPLQQGLRHLQTAFTNFFAGRTKYPNFKKKRNGGSAEFTKSAFKWKNGQIYLAKCQEPLPIRWSRQLPANCNPSTVTVSLDPSNRWHISIRFNDHRNLSLPSTDKQIGFDLGVTSLITTSDGKKIANPKHFKKLKKKLAKYQKALSRKQKGSNNRDKARLKVARIHAKIKDARRDFTHKLTTQLVSENQLIVFEDLAVKNMVKNHKLALVISDANWGEIIRQIKYKAEWYNREAVSIDRCFPSSKLCSVCLNRVESLPLNIREWDCPSCNTHHDRDINASINILAAGLAVSVCGATVRPEESKSRKAGVKNSPKREKETET